MVGPSPPRTTPSAHAQYARTFAPRTICTGKSVNALVALPGRTSTRTVSPRPARISARRRPRKPVAPVIRAIADPAADRDSNGTIARSLRYGRSAATAALLCTATPVRPPAAAHRRKSLTAECLVQPTTITQHIWLCAFLRPPPARRHGFAPQYAHSSRRSAGAWHPPRPQGEAPAGR
jgi:hypothetical protein